MARWHQKRLPIVIVAALLSLENRRSPCYLEMQTALSDRLGCEVCFGREDVVHGHRRSWAEYCLIDPSRWNAEGLRVLPHSC